MSDVKLTRLNQPPPTPSQEFVRKASEIIEVVDSNGRKILLRKPAVLAQFRIVEAVGPETAANATYMQMIMPLIYVMQVGEDAVEFPKKKSQVEALIQQLGDEGVDAVFKKVREVWGASDAEADKAEIKK